MTSFYTKPTTPPTGNRVAMLGDSVTRGNGQNTMGDLDPLMWAHFYSNGRIGYWKNAGIAGNTAAQMLARMDTDVLAFSPDWCIVMAGSNVSTSLAAYVSDMTSIIQRLKGANIQVALCTTPPTTTGVGTQKTEQYAQWVRAYALRNQIPLIDVRAVLQDSTTGTYLASYDYGDHVHPNVAGAKLIGQTISNTLASYLPPWSAPISMLATADAQNMVSNSLFLSDGNSDGIPDNWTKTAGGASATFTLVTGDTNIKGNWWRIQDSASEGIFLSGPSISSGFSVGDKLALTGRIRADAVNGTINIGLAYTGPSTVVYYISAFSGTIPDSQFYFEITVPATTTAIQPRININSSGVSNDFRIAQLALINLTTLGIA